MDAGSATFLEYAGQVVYILEATKLMPLVQFIIVFRVAWWVLMKVTGSRGD